MTVYFANAGLIDLDVLRVMGVSIKLKANPIGYFGTGLKFGVATLLRTGHKVVLVRGGERLELTARPVTIRGEEVQRVFMGEEALPFTTELGKNWDVWQAYRELHSNTLDEAGVISDKPQTGDTVIEVTGPGIQMEFNNRDAIFISGKPLAANEFLEVYPGPTRFVYYRGVRAGAMPTELSFAYNLLCPMTLTEDRTFESQFTVEWKLSQLIPKIEHAGVMAELMSGKDRWDQKLDWGMCPTPSKAFMDVATTRYTDQTINPSVQRVVDRDLQARGVFPPAQMTDAQHAAFLDAFAPLRRLGCTLSPEDVEVVESLGPGIMGLFHKERNQVFLAASTLDWGLETVVATLYEEWLHKDHHFNDCSRELQNYLFQRLVAMSMGLEPPAPKAKAGIGEDDVPF